MLLNYKALISLDFLYSMCIYSIFCGHIVKFLGEKEENELCEGVRAGCHGGYIRYIHRETHR